MSFCDLDEEFNSCPTANAPRFCSAIWKAGRRMKQPKATRLEHQHAAPSVRDRPGIASFAHDPAGSDVRSRFVRRCPRTVGVYRPDSCTAASCCWLGKPRRGRGDYSWGVGIGTRSNAYVSFYENREICNFRSGRQRRAGLCGLGNGACPGTSRSAGQEKVGPSDGANCRGTAKEPIAEPDGPRDLFKEQLPEGALARLGRTGFDMAGGPMARPRSPFQTADRLPAPASMRYSLRCRSGRLLQHIPVDAADKHHPRRGPVPCGRKADRGIGRPTGKNLLQMSVYEPCRWKSIQRIQDSNPKGVRFLS